MKSTLLAGAICLAFVTPQMAQAQNQNAPSSDDTTTDDPIVITGQRAQQERSIDVKRRSIGVVDVAAADDIGRLPDRNVAEVLDRVPGVGVLYDQGEGRYVSIRGVPAELNGYTVNGFEIGNPDPSTRALALDVISGQLLNRVEVVKLKTSDLNGQGIGGVTNLVTNTTFDFKKPFVVQASGQAGYQQLNDKLTVRGDASMGGRFGSEEQFGLLIGVSYSDRPFRSWGMYPDDWAADSDAARGGVPVNLKYSEYNIDRARHGATGSFDWRPDETTQFYIRGIYSKVIEDENRQRYRLDWSDLVFDDGGYTATATGTSARRDLRLDHNTKSVLAGMVGAQKVLGDLTLEAGLSRVHNVYTETDRVWQFRNTSGSLGNASVDFTKKVFYAEPDTELTANQLQFYQFTDMDARSTEDTWEGKLDATYKLGDSDSFVKIGAKLRSTDKVYDYNYRLYNRSSSTANRFTLADYNLQGETSNTYPSGSGQAYVLSPTIDTDKMVAFSEQYAGSSLMVLNQSTTDTNSAVADYDMNEKVVAAYAYGTFVLGDVTLTPGLRFEHTSLDVSGNSYQSSSTGSTIVPVSQTSEYSNLLPAFIARYKPIDSVILRFGYARAVGRPEFEDLSPGSTLNVTDETVSTGNPDLKPYIADSLDLSAEWYFARGGLISIAGFAKWIKNPIFSSTETRENVNYAGTTYDRLSFTQPMNADKGHIYGIELSYQQQFTFLPGLLSGLGFSANLTLTDSGLEVPGREEESTFPNQSSFIYGAQLFYQRGPLEASIGFHDTGHSLLTLGSDESNDQYSDDYRRLDAKISYTFGPGIHIFLQGQNLADEPTRQYQGGHRDWMIQNERYGRSIYTGISLSF